jgi:hypothetical protein
MQIIAAIEYDRLRKEPENWNKVILHRGYFDRDIKQFFLR